MNYKVSDSDFFFHWAHMANNSFNMTSVTSTIMQPFQCLLRPRNTRYYRSREVESHRVQAVLAS
jgi:hypothetical protein